MFTYKDKVYGITVKVTRDLEEYKRISKEEDLPINADGYTFEKKGCYYVWIKDDLSCPEDVITLSHEMIHVVSDVFEYTGVTDMHEAYAYYHSALIRYFIKRMRCK